VMLLASVDSIREVILFPTLRPEFAAAPGAGPQGAPRPVLPPTPVPAGGVVGGGGVGAEAQAMASVVALPDMAPSAHSIPAPARRGDHSRAVRVLAGLAFVGGVLQLFTQIPIMNSPIDGAEPLAIDPLWLPVTGHVVAVVAGLLLLLLADQLARRKRLAWQVALGLFALSAVAHVVKGPHPVAVLFCVVMLVLLIRYRGAFRAPADPPSLLRLVRFVPLYVVGVLAFGLVSLLLERDDLSPGLTLGGALVTIVGGLIGLDGPYTFGSPFFAAFFPIALIALGVAGLVVLVVLLTRPIVGRRPHTDDDWTRAGRLVRTYGWDTLAYFALRDDKSFFFAADGEAFIAYTYIGGYALVAGDPIGRRESVVAVLDEFLAFCSDRGWIPALLAAREASMPLYSSRGFNAFYLGDEAVIDCRRFGLEGSARKGLRAAVRRVGRTHRFQMVAESQAAPRLVEQLNAISARWRGKNPERGFTMSLSQDIVGAGANPEFLLCIALREDGTPSGFLRVVPAYGPSFGYTLDLMRHDPDAPNGMTEFLIAESALALRERGVARLSMNFAMWGRLFASDVPFSAAQRAARWAVGVMNPFFQIKSLHDFNAKFDPDWMPRVLAYQHRADLPRVGLLYAGAEGFLALPGLGELLVPRAVGGTAAPSDPGAAAA
ncbi:MAG: lysyl-tRNA synthetase, class, partial [Pseudonocardiales bacterium]|nr:lysyl-tRNA synthetase, class [Pseudonocardiales bacterium]